MDAFAAAAVAAEEEHGACVTCMERCQREHRAAGGGGQFASPALHPSFLRTVLEHNVRHNMAIPKAFVRTHGKFLPGSTVDLEGANGKVWLVTVVNSSTGTAVFRFGWHVFALDNNLKLGDAVLFTMVAKNRFTVRVFTRNGLEPLNPTIANIFPTDSPEQSPQHTSGDAYLAAYSDDDFARSGSESGVRNERMPEFRSGHGLTIQEIIDKARSYPTVEDPVRRSDSVRPRHPKRLRRRNRDAQQGRLQGHRAHTTVYESRRRIVTIAERERAVEESRQIMASLTCPSVAVVMMPSHVYRGFWLTLPTEFSRKHLPYNRMRVTLRDTFGDDWGTQWIRDDEHSGFSVGWASFSKDHSLEEGDVCVFEVQDAENFFFLVHICRVVGIPSEFPTRRGPAGWEVTYNVIKPERPHLLPDLNDVAKCESDTTTARVEKSQRLADKLQNMIRSGQFSNLRREEYEALPDKIRALAEMSVDDVKPDIQNVSKPVFRQFKRPSIPFDLSRDVSGVKPEPEDVHSMRPLLESPWPTYSAAPTGCPTEAKAEPMPTVMTGEEVSPLAVYSRRRRKHGTSSAANSASTNGDVDRVWHPVVRLLQKRSLRDSEKEFLVELMGTVPEEDRKRWEQGPNGALWLPSNHFSSDLSGCFL